MYRIWLNVASLNVNFSSETYFCCRTNIWYFFSFSWKYFKYILKKYEILVYIYLKKYVIFIYYNKKCLNFDEFQFYAMTEIIRIFIERINSARFEMNGNRSNFPCRPIQNICRRMCDIFSSLFFTKSSFFKCE